ncbi:hypothetical protein C8250_034370 [Streptomyces sp. So13.3]|nr:hypothetical protein C8250_034370 [Streptomyces sp. So13.3]
MHELEVGRVFDVVGDALNPLADAIRTTDGLEWVGCRHEQRNPAHAGPKQGP